MATLESIIQRATTIGIPIAHIEFKDTKQNPAPNPPFICWLSSEKNRGSDNKNQIREISASLELYTDRNPDLELEKQIENEVLYDVEFQKHQADIEDENMVQTAYEFHIVQKIGRRTKHG